MAAPDDGLRELGQEAQHRQARFRFQHGGQQGVHPGRAVVEQDARKMAGGTEAVEAPQLCGQRQALALRLHHQQHRQAQRVCQMPSTGGGTDAAQAVVIAHSAFQHRRAMACRVSGVQAAHRNRGGEKQVKVMAFHAQHGAVEHRVNIIRPRFKGTGILPPRLQRRQQGAGGGRFTAAGARRRQNQLQHVTPSQLKKPGCWPSASAGCPPLCCG